MDRIRSLVSLARRRLFLEAWLRASWLVAAVAVAVIVLPILERRLVGATSAISWWGTGLGWLVAAVTVALAIGAASGLVRARVARRSDEQVAMELDGRIDSGERFATAIALVDDAAAASDPFARAAIADAVAYAAQPELGGRVRSAFPVRAPERWWPLPAAVGLVLLAWLAVPQLERAEPEASKAAAASQVRKEQPAEEKRLEEVVKQIEQNAELARKLDAELAAARKTIDEGASGPVRNPEDAARESMKRLAELQERLAEVSAGKESQASRELRDALSKLELPKDQNAARDLSEALKQGDFKAAKDALAKLQEAAKSDGKLSQEEREKLAKALEDTARQLESLSKDPSKLADALKNAGMDPALANNPLALQQAIQASKDLNDSQKQALQQMAQSMQDAQGKLAQMSQQMSQMSEQARNPGQQGQQGQNGQQSQQSQQASGEGQQGGQKDQQQANGGQQSQQSQQSGEQGGQQGGASQMSQMLDEAETERQMAMAAEGAKSQCQSGGMSEGEADSALRSSSDDPSNASSNSRGTKSGSGGGRAVAEGGDRKFRETTFGTKFQKQKGERQEGDVIAQQLVAGESPTGESRVALEQVAERIAPGYERGTDDDPVPAHLREVHKKYFGDLRKKLEAKGVKAAPAPAAPTQPAAPAGGGANAK